MGWLLKWVPLGFGNLHIRRKLGEGIGRPQWTSFWNECTLPKTNMTIEKQPFEDVSPIKNGHFPLPCLFTGGWRSFCKLPQRSLANFLGICPDNEVPRYTFQNITLTSWEAKSYRGEITPLKPIYFRPFIPWKSILTIYWMVFPKRPWNFSRDLQSTIPGDYYFNGLWLTGYRGYPK